ncbi:pyridoxamine 5'-phosphate oxidase family protein [Actinophytocola sp.]|uniref:pyridoxamine 5'-phosphate oxidase family protein n=1 Tax=Actinophytocola sp. TaxID=1872138 RepID=UPI0025C427F3|nr:pyridoxamine 5'-phosphate oxidase family protein [Actinophytocola sp.]
MDSEPRQLRQLTKAESLQLLTEVSFGRVIFTQNTMPAVRPVNHIIDDVAVIFRTHLGAAVLTTIGMIVTYQADAIDPDSHLGWSVILHGYAHAITDPDTVARYEQLLRPWVRGEMTHVIRIYPEIVTGFELVKDE